MYAEDYENFKEELEDFTFEKSFLGEPFERIIEIAQGFLTKEVIEEFADLFEQIAVTLFDKYELLKQHTI